MCCTIGIPGRESLDEESVTGDGCRAFVRRKAQPLGTTKDRFVLRDDLTDGAIRADVERHRVERLVGAQRGFDVALALRLGECGVRGAHQREVGIRDVGDGLTRGESVHRRDHGLRVAHARGVERCNDRGSPGDGADQARADQFEQRFAHGCAADAEPRGQLRIA